MTLAIPAPTSPDEVKTLADQLRAHELPPPTERRAIRRRAGKKLTDVAEMLGVDPMSVSRWERGIAEPWPRNKTSYRLLLRALEQLALDREAIQVQK